MAEPPHSSARHGKRDDSVKACSHRRSFGLNLALTLCLAPVLVMGCGSATPAAASAGSSPITAAPTAAASGQDGPSASGGSDIFASRLYGYSLVVPPGWQTQPADSSWLTVGLEGRCPSDWDCFTGSSGEPTLAAAAASVTADQTLDQWRARMQVGLPAGERDDDQGGTQRRHGRRHARAKGSTRPRSSRSTRGGDTCSCSRRRSVLVSRPTAPR